MTTIPISTVLHKCKLAQNYYAIKMYFCKFKIQNPSDSATVLMLFCQSLLEVSTMCRDDQY